MTRPIIFRAKAVSSGQWVYGNLIHSKRFEGCSNEWRIHNQDTGLESDILPETVGQFTGLMGRNDRHVFEGDIFFEEVENDHGDERLYCVVIWLEIRAQFAMLAMSEYIEWRDNGDGILYQFENYEIDYNDLEKLHYAGNIHDNPDLI